MSGKVVGWAFDREEKLTPTQRFVLVAIADNADNHGRAWPSKKELARKTGLNLVTVYRALAKLKELGLFEERVEEGREHFYLAVLHTANRSHGAKDDLQDANQDLQGAKSTKQRTVNEPSDEPALLASPEQEVFEHWRTVFGMNGSTRLTEKRKKKIAARLKDSGGVEEVKLAITGASLDPWITGEHPDSPGYGLTTILRDADQITRFARLARARNRGSGPVERRVNDGVPQISRDGGKTWESDYDAVETRS